MDAGTKNGGGWQCRQGWDACVRGSARVRPAPNPPPLCVLPCTPADAPETAKKQLEKLGPLSLNEKITAGAFAVTVALWIGGSRRRHCCPCCCCTRSRWHGCHRCCMFSCCCLLPLLLAQLLRQPRPAARSRRAPVGKHQRAQVAFTTPPTPCARVMLYVCAGGGAIGVNAVAAATVGLAILLITNVVTWKVGVLLWGQLLVDRGKQGGARVCVLVDGGDQGQGQGWGQGKQGQGQGWGQARGVRRCLWVLRLPRKRGADQR